MYKQYFGFTELPFSIVPNSRFLFRSLRHKEALFRLQAGLGEGSGFALLSGEVGTGKTTVARALLKSLGTETQSGLILNPTFSSIELLEAICDEFSIIYEADSSLKQLSKLIHDFLLDSYAKGLQTLLVIDEAQHLSADVLEQLRLLTNLETESQKLFKVLLVGQPELQQKLKMPQLRQLAQRITGRYHLLPLDEKETIRYIQYRLECSGGNVDLFSSKSIKHIAQQSSGIPRLVNLICDHALKRAYSLGEPQPSWESVDIACEEVMSFQTSYQPIQSSLPSPRLSFFTAFIGGTLLAMGSYALTPLIVADRVSEQIAQAYPLEIVPPLEKEVFPPYLQNLLKGASSFEQGIDDLYQVWGIRASVSERYCRTETTSVFRCVRERGSLEEIRDADRPVLLFLRHQNVRGYAVLYRLNTNTAQLLLGRQRIALPIDKLESIWDGQYHQIWQGYWNQTLKPTMSGPAVAEFAQRLSNIMGEPHSDSDRYDQSLQKKVELFQQWQGLDVDGIAGRRTLQRLEKLSQDIAPTLSGPEEEV
ncbi:AAA family ATPase [Vibrio ostreicida]|uniref:ExeA family protein n=1 Tax=Vibrio ostreicida TaxID=526588 RepID=UPI003B5AB1CF